jgi:peptide/nickel transport system substrate-binding protein
MMHPIARTLTFSITLCLVMAGCAPSAATPSIDTGSPRLRDGGVGSKRIVASMMGEPAGFIARMSNTQISVPGGTALEQLVHASLTEMRDDRRYQPVLAEAVPTLENGQWTMLPDGRMETTWQIRAGAAWHDGTPLTADDLVFTTVVDLDKDLPIFRRPAYSYVERVLAPDARTVRVTWSQPFIEADSMFSATFGSPLPRHLLEEAFHTDKARFLAHPYWAQEFVGTGPFTVAEWVPGAYIRLKANDRYVLGRPKLDEIEMRFVLDLNTLMTNLLSGAIDLTLGRGFTVEPALQLRDQWKDGKLELRPSSWIVIMPQFLTPSPALVAEVPFRQALMHATDRQQLVDTLQGGLSYVAHAYLNPTDAEHKEVERAIVRYAYDPRRAAELMEQLGYRRGSDGSYRSTAGDRLALELRSNGERITEDAIIPVADAWTRQGISTEPVLVPQQRTADREYMANFPSFRMMRQPNEATAVTRHHSSQLPVTETRYVGRNYARYVNGEFDSLIDRFVATVPWQERMQVLGQVVHHMTEHLTHMGLFYDMEFVFMKKPLQNVGASDSELWNVHLWDLAA